MLCHHDSESETRCWVLLEVEYCCASMPHSWVTVVIKSVYAVRYTIQLGACTWHYVECMLLHSDKLISSTHNFQNKFERGLCKNLNALLTTVTQNSSKLSVH